MSRSRDSRPSARGRLPSRRSRLSWAIAAGLSTLACTGSVGGNHGGGANPPDDQGAGAGGASAGPSSGGSGGTGSAPIPSASVSAAVAPLRRLTRQQYLNTVRDLLGVANAVAPDSLPGDDAIQDRFRSNTVSPLQSIDVGKYADAADGIAGKAVANLATLVPCDPKAMGEAACAKSFIDSFGQRAYRRPLSADEAALMQTVYAAGGDFATGIRLVVSALLQSPKFLYLREPMTTGPAGTIVGVDAWAMAARLSYFLLGTMPDDMLFAAAEHGQLATTDQVAAQAMRLTADPRFRDTLANFHSDWLQLDQLAGAEKDATLFPAWNPALRSALSEEAKRFVEYVFTDGDRSLQTLLSAPFTFLSGPLYAQYGVAGPATGTDWTRVDLPKNQRAGILTESGLMAALAHDNRTSFILRGKMVREAIFCTPPLVAPPDVPPEPKVDPMASAKVRSEAHRKDPACATCHDLFDPIGFAFEIYDATGRYRTTDGAGPIDSRVELTHTRGLDGKSAANAVELAGLLATADEVRDCVARQWVRFALGRDDSNDDSPSLMAATQSFEQSGGKLPDLLQAVVRSDSFRFQKVPQ